MDGLGKDDGRQVPFRDLTSFARAQPARSLHAVGHQDQRTIRFAEESLSLDPGLVHCEKFLYAAERLLCDLSESWPEATLSVVLRSGAEVIESRSLFSALNHWTADFPLHSITITAGSLESRRRCTVSVGGEQSSVAITSTGTDVAGTISLLRRLAYRYDPERALRAQRRAQAAIRRKRLRELAGTMLSLAIGTAVGTTASTLIVDALKDAPPPVRVVIEEPELPYWRAPAELPEEWLEPQSTRAPRISTTW